MSYAMMPPKNALFILILVAGFLGYRLWKPFNKVYFQGKAALAETFSKSLPEEDLAPETTQINLVLREARLETLVISEGMPGAGKSLRELDTKAKTGALVVGIEREGTEIVNPEADEMLKVGDRVLLLGNKRQLDAALEAISGAPDSIAV